MKFTIQNKKKDVFLHIVQGILFFVAFYITVTVVCYQHKKTVLK